MLKQPRQSNAEQARLSAGFVEQEVRGMFEMKYIPQDRHVMSTGWNSVNDDDNYLPLSSRIHKADSRTVDDGVLLNSVEESTSIDGSSEDELAPTSRVSRSLAMESLAVSESRETVPLIRLGECLIVDWKADAFETVFGGQDDDDDRGQSTLRDPRSLELLQDPELDAKRKARSQRRKNGLTLEECLDEFGKEEILSEMDMWYCPRCKEHRRASKKFELWRTPDIMVMHLKRFSSGAMRRDKLDVHVDFPIEGLDLSSRVIEKRDGKTEVFDLFVVDDHSGGLGGGHYTAYSKSFVDGQWYEYNGKSARVEPYGTDR
jgi:hypothetical protein